MKSPFGKPWKEAPNIQWFLYICLSAIVYYTHDIGLKVLLTPITIYLIWFSLKGQLGWCISKQRPEQPQRFSLDVKWVPRYFSDMLDTPVRVIERNQLMSATFLCLLFFSLVLVK